jgi:Putative peptidoglycan binding domain
MPRRLPDPRVGGPTPDDWLGEQGEVDWGDDPRARREQTSRSSDSAVGPAGTGSSDTVAGPSGPPLSAAEARRLAVVQRRRAIALVALVALALVGIGVGLTVFRDDEPSTPTTPPPAAASPPPATPPAATTSPPAETTTPLRIELPASGRLAFGDRGEEVETLQTALAALELGPGEADGIFGEATKEAVLAFQRANDLTADGIAGADTVRKLNAALAEQGVTR